MENAHEYIKKSFELKNGKLYKEAIELLYKALSLEPDNKEVLAQIGDLYVLLKNFSRAVEQYEKVLESDKEHSHSAVSLCEIYILQKNYKKALSIAEELTKNSPITQNFTNYFTILANLNMFETIKNIFDSLNEEIKKDDNILYFAGLAYLKTSEKETAEKFFKASLMHNPKNVKSLFEIGKINFKKNDFRKAAENFERIEGNAEAYNYLGLIELHFDNTESAIDFFTNAMKIEPENAQYAYNAAGAYALNGWFDEAQSFFQKAVLIEPVNAVYRYALAEIYFQQGHYEKAQSELDILENFEVGKEELYAFLTDAKILRSVCDCNLGFLYKAKAQLEEIYDENNFFLMSSLAKVYKLLKLHEKAIQTYKKAFALKADSYSDLNDFAQTCIDAEKYDEAKNVINGILKKFPNSVHAYNSLARIYFREKNYEKTLENLDTAVKLDNSYAEAYYFKGLTLNSMNKPEDAIDNLKTAITLNPTPAKYYAQLGTSYKRLKKYNEAFLFFKEAVELDATSVLYKKEASDCAKLAGNKENAEFYSSLAKRTEKIYKQ